MSLLNKHIIVFLFIAALCGCKQLLWQLNVLAYNLPPAAGREEKMKAKTEVHGRGTFT
jgi:hypothetical protein